jgi:cysteine desulfurase
MFVYLDNSATTRQYGQVTQLMMRLMDEDYGNPSSLHRMGVTAERAVKEARRSVASSLGVRDEEVVFTGSGTEADNMAIFGAYNTKKRRGNKIITSTAEHPAVMEACKKLELSGVEVVYAGIDGKGLIDMDELESHLDESTILVTVMAVNNELGTVQPTEEIGTLLKAKGDILFHTDAVQAFGKVPVDPQKWKADLVTVSSHKIHGPKGIGALYIKKGLHMEPYIYGGGQERGMRSGTENTPGIAGFGLAAEMVHDNLHERMQAMERARNYLLEGIKAEIPDIRINSPEAVFGVKEVGTKTSAVQESEPKAGEVQKAEMKAEPRVEQNAEMKAGSREKTKERRIPASSPGILNVSFLGCRGEVLLHTLEQRDIYVSTGAACSSKKKGSRVLAAAGLAAPVIDSAIRFSFSEFNTVEQMDYVLIELKKAVASMRRLTQRL